MKTVTINDENENLKLQNVTINKAEAYAIAEFIDANIFEAIRADTDWDSFQNLRNLIHGYEKCCKISGFVGVTDDGKLVDDAEEDNL